MTLRHRLMWNAPEKVREEVAAVKVAELLIF